MAVHSTTWQWMSRFIEDLNDFTDSIQAPRIPIKITSDCGFVCEPLYETDEERFNIAVEYLTEILEIALEGPQ